MSERLRVIVKRERHRHSAQWYVSCTHCSGHPFWPVPWSYAQNHATALMLAAWHVAEHERTHCSACDRHHKIKRPEGTPGDPSRFTIGTRLFRVGPHRVVELVEVPATSPGA